MIIDVRNLNAHGKYKGDFAFGYTPGEDKVLVPLCGLDGDVQVNGSYEIYEDGSVGVYFKITYLLKGQCSYCLESAQSQIGYETEVLFVREETDDDYRYDGVKIDLTDAVNDAFIFSQPAVLLCRPDCDGIKLS